VTTAEQAGAAALTPRQLFAADRARYYAHSWSTERALWAVAVYRLGQWVDLKLARVPSRRLRSVLRMPYQLLGGLSQALTGIELLPATRVGPGLRIHHGGNIVINPDVRIGANCLLRHGVTLGNLSEGSPSPVIGDDVEFGAYAQVLGPVRVGDGARIGALSLVLQDVPAGATAVGIPARIIEPGAPAHASHPARRLHRAERDGGQAG
jgi:serine O-acetyltransferase